MNNKSSLILLFINISYVFTRHQKPVPKLLWTEHCQKNAIALNDCNWCWCDNNNRYACKARVCSDVDMFGHFNDAIREVDAGMEGHGVWRSTDTPCEPGVHYRKSALLCVCTEDGTWPNPVCRDVFQVLHSVEVTQYSYPSQKQSCTPTKLHLIGCNVCICPPSGTINPQYCTNRDCNEKPEEPSKEIREDTIDEIYATCNPSHNYKLGCKSCVCLRNNRLLCDNCTTGPDQYLRKRKSLCSGRPPHKMFANECNMCYCDSNNTMYCSTKKCLQNEANDIVKLRLPRANENDRLVERPMRDEDCIPGTVFQKDCNECACTMIGGIKIVGCTVKLCFPLKRPDPNSDCVVGTTYEDNCVKCYCKVEDGAKKEVCVRDESCNDNSGEIKNLDSMHGYCEPMHSYMKDCNKCTCLADGNTIACTSKICPPKESRPLITELMPVLQPRDREDCPAGHSYKVDCNYCFCMKHGDAICTRKKCKRRF